MTLNAGIRESCFPVVKTLPANAGDTRDAGSMSGWEDSLEKEMAL